MSFWLIAYALESRWSGAREASEVIVVFALGNTRETALLLRPLLMATQVLEAAAAATQEGSSSARPYLKPPPQVAEAAARAVAAGDDAAATQVRGGFVAQGVCVNGFSDAPYNRNPSRPLR